MRTAVVSVTVLVGAIIGACGHGPTAQARLTRTVPWAASGELLAIDTHTHTTFSDGAGSVRDVVDHARRFGCGALAITDHADRSLTATTDAYRVAIESARAEYTDVVILAGLEWNLPPWGGDEHATLLVPQGPAEWQTLAEFKARFDDFELDGAPQPQAADALRWLASTGGVDPAPVVIYNHPSRPDASSVENVDDVVAWRAVNDLVVGIEGAPGHQGDDPIGSYRYQEKTIDRWDPAVARPGDAWDTLLARGVDVWGAGANSDFHAEASDLNDFWPCQFAETWVRVPERTVAGVLRALRAGSFFGVHGRIARDVAISVSTEGATRPATAGEELTTRVGAEVHAAVAFTVTATDWRGEANHIDTVEFIVITADGASQTDVAIDGVGRQAATITLTVPAGGLVVRARGRRVVADGPDLLFYTNPIRIRAED